MPAMWDTLKTATATGPTALQLPQPAAHNLKSRKKPFRSHTLPVEHGGERDYWQNEFDNRLHGLGITNRPYRFEIRRGKTVPRPASGAISPPADSDDILRAPRVRNLPAPPRPPRRPPRPSDWRSISPFDDEPPVATSRSRLRAKAMYGRPTGVVEISPPSSPELQPSRYGVYPDEVSPIDEGPDQSQQELLRGETPPQPPPHRELPQTKSHIPLMRREKRRDQEVAHNGLRESRSKDRLRDHQNPATKLPWEDAQSSPENVQQGFGLTTTVTGPQTRTANSSSTFGQRVRQFTRSKAEPVDTRPPWNGTSVGRSATVEPVYDDLTVAPLKLPRRNNSKRGNRNGRLSPAGGGVSETSSGATATVRRLLPSRSNQKLKDAAKSSQTDLNAAAAQAYPSPPQLESPTLHESKPSHAPLLSPDNVIPNSKATKRKPSPSTILTVPSHSQASTSNSAYAGLGLPDQLLSLLPRTQLATNAPSSSLFLSRDPWVQPVSRFSITTCATSIADTVQASDTEDERFPTPTQSPEIPSHIPSSHIPSPHIPSPHIPSPHIPSPHIPSPHIPSPHIASPRIISPHAPSPKLPSPQPPSAQPPSPQLPSVMDRRRPVPGGDYLGSASAEPIVISMNSSYTAKEARRTEDEKVDAQSPPDRPASAFSTSKALPPAPPEIQSAHDRVAHLNARLESLAHRRININRSIKQMTELMPTDNLMASADVLRKREVEKKKVEGLREELSEIQREEHDLGLKLHRAYKRLEREADYEPTTLWVRRVTH